MTRGEMSKNSEQMRGEEVDVGLFGGEARLRTGHFSSESGYKGMLHFPNITNEIYSAR